MACLLNCLRIYIASSNFTLNTMPFHDDFSILALQKVKPSIPSLINRILAASVELYILKYGYIPSGAELMDISTIKKLGLELASLNMFCDKYRYLMTIN